MVWPVVKYSFMVLDSKFDRIKAILESLEEFIIVKNKLCTELTILIQQESDNILREQIENSLEFLKSNDQSILLNAIRKISSKNIKTIFFCVPMKTWMYKSMEMTFNLLFCEKCYWINNLIDMLELETEKITDEIKHIHGLSSLYLNRNIPKLIATTIVEVGGELAKDPKHFALFFPDFLIFNMGIQDNLVTLYFPEVYLKRHREFVGVFKKINSNLIDDKSLIIYLTIWFKGHELGHSIRNSLSDNFWDEVKLHYSTFETGILEELLADIFGLHFSFRYLVITENLCDFINVYLIELFLYSDRERNNDGMFFEDSASANIQINYLLNWKGLKSSENDNEVAYITKTEFRTAFNALFVSLFEALTTIGSEQSKTYITKLLDYKVLKKIAIVLIEK